MEKAYCNFKKCGISSTDFLAKKYKPKQPNRWINIKVGTESIEEVHSTIMNIIDKYEDTFRENINADKLNKGLFK